MPLHLLNLLNDGGIVVVVVDLDEERVRGGGEDAAAIPLSHHRAV